MQNVKEYSNKILIILPNDNLGGAESILKMIAEELSETDHSVQVFFLSKVRNLGWVKKPNITFQYSNFSSQYAGALSLVLFLFANKTNYLFCFSSHVYVNGLLGFLRKIRLLKTKFFVARESTSIFTRYQGIRLRFYKFFYYLGYSKIDLLICQTEKMKKSLSHHLPSIINKIKVETIPNPFMFPSEILINDTEQQQLIKKQLPYIVTAGRLIPEKGFDILIQSFALLLKQSPNLKLVILGEGEERQKLQNIIEGLDVASHVLMLGFTKNVYPWFRNAEVAIVSSRLEGYPNVLLQMMSQNHKVVSTLCAGGIEDLKGVFTAQTNSIESLQQAISEALQSSENERIHFQKELKNRNIFNFMKKIYDFLLKDG